MAEQRFLSNSTEWEFDNAWQEMLNHATIKVMAAEKQKTESEAEHLKLQSVFTAAEQVSISSTFYEQLLRAQIPKAQKAA